MLTSSLVLALDRLRANGLRSALTILGIVIGITSVVALVSVGGAVQVSIEDEVGGLGAGTLTVISGGGLGLSSEDFQDADGPPEGGGPLAATPDAEPLTAAEVDALSLLSGVAAIAPLTQQLVTVQAGGEELSATALATTPALETTDSLDLAAGSFLSDVTTGQRLPVAVLGTDVAEELGLDGAEAIGAEVRLERRTYRVVGVLEPLGGASFIDVDGAVIVPLTTAEGTLLDADPDLDSIRVLAATESEAALSVEVAQTLRQVRGLTPEDDDDFSIIEATAVIDFADQISATLTLFVGVIGGISLVVGAIGVANMMLVSVRERTREIGVRRAVGATRGDITAQFLVEAVVLSLIGGVVGTAFGAGLAAWLASALLEVPAFVSTGAIGLALGVSLLVGVVAGIGPAYKAAAVDPTTALRYE